MSEQARAAIGSDAIEAVADRGYYSGEEIVACEQVGITVYLPKQMTSGLLAKGRFGKQDFVYVAADDVYLMRTARCSRSLVSGPSSGATEGPSQSRYLARTTSTAS
jgi:hypothetical protein